MIKIFQDNIDYFQGIWSLVFQVFQDVNLQSASNGTDQISAASLSITQY